MIKNVQAWEEFERERERSTPIDVERNFRVLDALYEHARILGTFPPEDPFAGVEDTIRFVEVLHASKAVVDDRE